MSTQDEAAKNLIAEARTMRIHEAREYPVDALRIIHRLADALEAALPATRDGA